MQSQKDAKTHVLIWRKLTSVFKPWCVKTFMVTALLVYLIYIGITLYLFHYYLDPSYQHFNATYSVNVVDLFVPSFTLGIMFNFMGHCVNIYSKVGLYWRCIIFLGFLIFCALLEFMIAHFIIISNIDVYTNVLFNIIFFATLNLFIFLIPILNILMTCVNSKSVIITLSLFYFILFVGTLATLQLPGSNTPIDPSWEDTKSYNYISVVNLIFVALQLAVNTLGFFLSAAAIYYDFNNQLQEKPITARGQGSDYDSDSRRLAPETVLSSSSESEEDIPIQAQASRLSDSNQLKEAKDHIPFLHYEPLNCDHNGLNYVIADHDITLRIPEGAVAVGEKVHFEVGVAMYSPLYLPGNTQPISPILWLHLLEEDIKLNKDFELILPHCYTGLVTPPDLISFAIADHRSLKDITSDKDGQPCYLLKLWETGIIDQMYGAIQIDLFNHIFCIVKHTKYGNWCQDISFSLARVDLPPSSTVQEFHFYGLFDLATHRKALEIKLQRNGHAVSFSTPFKFSDINDRPEPSIKLISLATDRITLLNPAVGAIRAYDINYWNLSFKKFKEQEKNGAYPPRIRMQVFHTGPDVDTFPIKFTGCTSDSNLEYELFLSEAPISSQPTGIDEGHVVVELKSLSSNVAIDPTLVEGTTHLTDTSKPTQTDNDMSTGISDDGDLIQMQEIHRDGDRIQLVHQSTYFNTAEKIAHVPFLDHQMLECDCSGREYTNVDHDITLRIPKGAVAEGEKVHFEVGVAMYGPFIFPENTQPISPILWLCLLEEDAQLKKPFQVILPHYLTGLSKERIQYHQVGFAKANHSGYTFEDNQMRYEFQHCDAKPLLPASGYRNYGVLISKHCCFYCLEAKLTPELAMDAGYCLVRIESCISPQKYEFYFAGIYFLETCLRSLEEQFPHEEGYRISRYDSFKFKDISDPFIQVITPAKNDQCLVGFEPSQGKIMASDIMFWSEGFNLMKRKHERNIYPPRVKMTVSMTDPDHSVILPVRISGCEDDGKLDMELTLPLGLPSRSPTSSFSGSRNSEPQSQAIICGKPELKDAFKKLLSLATHWKTIGTLLGISKPVLDRIRSDEEGANDRLQEMLAEWLKQTDPPPTWTALADAVEMVDSSKAQEIRKHCVDMPNAVEEDWI